MPLAILDRHEVRTAPQPTILSCTEGCERLESGCGVGQGGASMRETVRTGEPGTRPHAHDSPSPCTLPSTRHDFKHERTMDTSHEAMTERSESPTPRVVEARDSTREEGSLSARA